MTENSYPVVELEGGIRRQVRSQTPEMMVVAVDFPNGGVGGLHSHPHVQSTYVRAGRFRFSVEGAEIEVASGDSLIVPPNAMHGCVCIEAGQLIDVFSPRRDDFL